MNHTSEVNILPYHGEVFLYPDFFSPQESDTHFQRLQQEIDWRQEPLKIMGKEIMQPRLTAWYGEKPYSYSGITMEARPWAACLLPLLNAIQTFTKRKFSGVLLNRYRNGQDSMGWHRDNEKMLGTNPVVVSLNFGATRVFQFRAYKTHTEQRSAELTHGSLLLMQGETQHHWEHRIPKTSKPVGERINLTFRQIL